MGFATYIKPAVSRGSGFKGDARVYRLEPALIVARPDYASDDDNAEIVSVLEYVVVSAVEIEGEGPETYIFASDGQMVTDFSELSGSFKGDLDHERALGYAGYVLADDLAMLDAVFAVADGDAPRAIAG